MSSPWSVYIVRCADSSLYTGIAKDVAMRIEKHNSGKGAKYTRSRAPVKPVYVAECSSRLEAAREECRIKKLSRKQKEELICQKVQTGIA